MNTFLPGLLLPGGIHYFFVQWEESRRCTYPENWIGLHNGTSDNQYLATIFGYEIEWSCDLIVMAAFGR